jgi:hypothetical protein
MFTTLKTRPRSTAMTKQTNPFDDTETGLPQNPAQLGRMGPEGEAPEDAVRESEPPEFREVCHSEAPDAGQGESYSIEREFTHGRSWS